MIIFNYKLQICRSWLPHYWKNQIEIQPIIKKKRNEKKHSMNKWCKIVNNNLEEVCLNTILLYVNN